MQLLHYFKMTINYETACQLFPLKHCDYPMNVLCKQHITTGVPVFSLALHCSRTKATLKL